MDVKNLRCEGTNVPAYKLNPSEFFKYGNCIYLVSHIGDTYLYCLTSNGMSWSINKNCEVTRLGHLRWDN